MAAQVKAGWSKFEEALIGDDYELLLTSDRNETIADAVLLVDFGVDMLYAVPCVPGIDERPEDCAPPLARTQQPAPATSGAAQPIT